jgi:NAD+ synthase (glutamine-hydrolysing)
MPKRQDTQFLRLALAQMNPIVGDLSGNAKNILELINKAKRTKADFAVFPELALTGYPPEDLILKPQFILDNLAEIERLSGLISGIAAFVGFVDSGKNGEIYNAAALIADGRIIDVYHKILLPNYGVFDEFRYFRPGTSFPVYLYEDIRIGINICEDIWHRTGPARVQAAAGAGLIININASPYERGKPDTRERILAERSSENGVMIAYLNTVGGQDELVFDGMSMVFDRTGCLRARGRQFEEEMMIADIDISEITRPRGYRPTPEACLPPEIVEEVRKVRVPVSPIGERTAAKGLKVRARMKDAQEVYSALVLGTADYVRKNGFGGVVIGLSGGIDSSLVSTIATDAIGRENVHVLFMPSRYTSEESREDAFQLAANLGIAISEIPIDAVFTQYLSALQEGFSGMKEDTTEENLQARIRGNLLMAFSNKFGWLVLTTGNKSEMSVGYATLYGDMAGGFAVIKDVPKTLVYELCRWRNTAGEAVIPERVLSKAPTAELKPDQKDSDTLPPYEILDPILRAYIEEELPFEEILGLGSDPDSTRKVIAMVDRSEYKRRQSPPGVKITPRAFGRDRRFPITSRYRSY